MRPSALQRPDWMTVAPSHTRLYATPSRPLASPNRFPTMPPQTLRPHPPKNTDLPALTHPAKAKDTTAPTPKAHRHLLRAPTTSSHTEAPHPQVPSRLHAPARLGPLPTLLLAPPPAPAPDSRAAQPRSRGTGGPRNAQPASGRRASRRRVAPVE